MPNWNEQSTFFKNCALAAIILVPSSVNAAQAQFQVAILQSEPSIYHEFRAERAEYDTSSQEDKPVVLIINQSLSEVLSLAAEYNGYELIFSGALGGTLMHMALPYDVREMLHQLSTEYDLAWHFDAPELYVSDRSTQVTREIFIGNVLLNTFGKVAETAGIAKSMYSIQPKTNDNSLTVTGPASYIDGLSAIAKRLTKERVDDEQ
ncbi:MAG: hypothetical protein AAF217_01440 [Pseudomonadota bacterium]